MVPPGLGASRCSTGQLALSYLGTQGATGHLEVTFALHNVSARTCALRGYPGGQMLDTGGRRLPTHVKRGHGFFPDTLLAPRRVTLAPGASAHFGLSFSTNNEYRGGGRRCPAAATLRSVPPNARQPLSVQVSGAGHPRFAPCGGQLVATVVYRP